MGGLSGSETPLWRPRLTRLDSRVAYILAHRRGANTTARVLRVLHFIKKKAYGAAVRYLGYAPSLLQSDDESSVSRSARMLPWRRSGPPTCSRPAALKAIVHVVDVEIGSLGPSQRSRSTPGTGFQGPWTKATVRIIVIHLTTDHYDTYVRGAVCSSRSFQMARLMAKFLVMTPAVLTGTSFHRDECFFAAVKCTTWSVKCLSSRPSPLNLRSLSPAAISVDSQAPTDYVANGAAVRHPVSLYNFQVRLRLRSQAKIEPNSS